MQSGIQTCIDDILYWINTNKLTLNTDRTKVMAVGASSHLSLVDCNLANIGGSNIPFKTSVKYLGIKTDHSLSMKQCLSCLFSWIKMPWVYLTLPFQKNCKTSRCLITSCLHYCSSISAGLLVSQIGWLQRVQNSAAWLDSLHNRVSPLWLIWSTVYVY